MVNFNDVFQHLDADVQEYRESIVIPENYYGAMIVRDELFDTRDGTGKILQFIFQIIDGEYQNMTIKHSLNILNRNPKAQNIAQGSLKNICRLCDTTYPPMDTTDIIGKQFTIYVVKDKFINDNGNEIIVNKIKRLSQYKNNIINNDQNNDIPF